MMKRVHIISCGRVQGVSYRDNVNRKAKELKIDGYVKNMPDGTVEIVAQGMAEKIKELIDFCRNDPGYSKVAGISVKEEKTSDELIGFVVRF